MAAAVRALSMDAVQKAKSGHPGMPMGMADIAVALFTRHLRHNPLDPKWIGRDRFILSNGHGSMLQYAMLHLTGYDLTMDDIKNFRQLGSKTPGHPEVGVTPGVETTTGPLGQGIANAVGMALAGKLAGKDYRVYTILGDGEIQEGQVWESAMFAAQHKLDHLCYIVDNNGLQIDGDIADVCSPYPIDEKFAAFGFEAINANGHDFDEIEAAFEKAKKVQGKPAVIIFKTVKGKGISFMENQASWHGAAPNAEQYEVAVKDLDKIDAEVR